MTDPHAKRRQADGRNSWKKMALTPGAQEEFAAWLLENGLRKVLWGRIDPGGYRIEAIPPKVSK